MLQRGGTGSIFGGGATLIVQRLRHCQPGFSQAINRNGSGITGIKEFGADDAAGHDYHVLLKAFTAFGQGVGQPGQSLKGMAQDVAALAFAGWAAARGKRI